MANYLICDGCGQPITTVEQFNVLVHYQLPADRPGARRITGEKVTLWDKATRQVIETEQVWEDTHHEHHLDCHNLDCLKKALDSKVPSWV